jgi:hypothetical protein
MISVDHFQVILICGILFVCVEADELDDEKLSDPLFERK